MSNSIHQLVTDQFAPTAASYAVSAVHGNAQALAELVALVDPKPTDEVLDVATGAGHVALAFAPRVAKVVAYDLTPSMLEQTLASARGRGLSNIETQQGTAEKLPFADASFDIYTVRLAPHHFADTAESVREAARVLRPGGRYLVVDTASPEDAGLAVELDEIERLRDPSHVHNYSPSEWRQMVEDAGLTVEHEANSFCDEGRAMDFDDWVIRMRTPEDAVTELRRRFTQASPELRRLLDISIDGNRIGFRLPQVTMLARKAG
ncbi:class I SAM-dependent methyltransferase [Fimbriimonas ginsengisoli]|uniref:Putative S-adenosyl-L-methionine-dependent methyltransferase n=1 Tax=Fimbriimonas ginsengisoli Gsoil 348 TaxID=661478 RepID=A0A068NVV0_FIMGI|nr:methyltransferase domain-containing protein [Fimbriimonas ginsengisoli]AIE85734.1 putative S-adenosyl-L-methionine-dependent methyltransferase [Fimbriimonas ginsengisoli Gsoil 348]